LHRLYKGLRTSIVVVIAACGGMLAAVVLSKVSWWNSMPPATASSPSTEKVDPNNVRVTPDQMHQLELVKVGLCSFRQQKTAIGQIAFNENASTNVFTPFSGRVTRLMAQVGDEVKRGDPLFEIDSPEVVQVQTDLIAALHARDKANSHLDVMRRQADATPLGSVGSLLWPDASSPDSAKLSAFSSYSPDRVITIVEASSSLSSTRSAWMFAPLRVSVARRWPSSQMSSKPPGSPAAISTSEFNPSS